MREVDEKQEISLLWPYIKVCYILKDRNQKEYFSPDFVKMDFQRSPVQCLKHMKVCHLRMYIKVSYILKDRNTGEYFSPDFMKMDF